MKNSLAEKIDRKKIFITLGSQKFQFNRLLEEIDYLIKQGVVKEDVFAQSGYSDYIPQYYGYKNFLDREEFAEMEKTADIIITHGGTGAIIGAVKNGKKVIAVPRRAKYGEHVDDHQLQLIEQFTNQNLICGLRDCSELQDALKVINETSFSEYKSNTEKYIENIDIYIQSVKNNK